jgi:hypothetical protein
MPHQIPWLTPGKLAQCLLAEEKRDELNLPDEEGVVLALARDVAQRDLYTVQIRDTSTSQQLPFALRLGIAGTIRCYRRSDDKRVVHFSMAELRHWSGHSAREKLTIELRESAAT